jgi:putative ABC transport system permease protein
MSFWRQLARGLRRLTSRENADREIDDEVRHYLDEATAAHIARGLSPADASRAARIELGGVANVTEQMRGVGWEHLVDTLIADLRYAARRLRAAPVFTIVVVLTLAVGIGGSAAIFSAVNPILFEPLPYPNANRIAMIWEIFRETGARHDTTFGMIRELAARASTFEAIAAIKAWQPTMIGGVEPERLEGQRVSASYFHVLGVSPALGRGFVSEDDRVNGPNVTILSDALWRRRFHADRAIVGRSITLDDTSFIVIGVMPPAFENVLAPEAELWAPLQYGLEQGRAWGHHLRSVAKLRAGASADRATHELNAIGNAVLREQRPPTYRLDVQLQVVPLQDDVVRAVKPALLAILGGVTLVLAIACVNAMNLLLARGAQRRGELALRVALGAGRGRVIRQLLTESLLLAAIGGAVGVIIAHVGVRALVALSPPDLPRVGAIAVDRPVFAFALAITTIIGLAFGIVPARQAARTDPGHDLQQVSRRTIGGHWRTRHALVIAEVALALVLLVSSGLLLRSLQRLFAVDAGFDASHLLTMQIQTSGRRFDNDETTYRFFAEALDAVRRVPGVEGAALTSQLPLSGDLDRYGVHFVSSPVQRRDEDHSAFRYAVSPGYIETMRMPLRHGRVLDERDRAGAPLVALINDSFARRNFPSIDPIGQRLRIGPSDSPPYTIVGVVGDVRQMSLALGQPDAVYVTAAQWRFADSAMSLIVRVRGEATTAAPAIRQAVWSVDKDQPIVRVATMQSLVTASAAARRFALILFEAFALAALVLAAAGLYGVLAGRVAERTQEIGVRASLGASRRDIVTLVLGEGVRLASIGLAIGLVAAAIASRGLDAMLFGISPLDPITYLGVIGLLAIVALIASSVPAWRAVRVDPAITLRAE